MIDFSQIPCGYETADHVPDLEEFRRSFKQLDDLPKFKHLSNLTYRATNGYHLASDSEYAEVLEGYCESFPTTEDSVEDPVVAVFVDCGMDLSNIHDELFKFLLIELSRLRLIIRTDLHTAIIAHIFWDLYHHDEADDHDPYASYPKWFLPLLEARDRYHGNELRNWMWEQLDSSQTLMSVVAPEFKKEKRAIVEAVDRLAEAEEPLVNNPHDHTEYFSGEEGIFYFGRRNIDFHEDVMEALYTGLAENCQNPKRGLVGMARNEDKLREINDYLHAADDLFELCKNLP